MNYKAFLLYSVSLVSALKAFAWEGVRVLPQGRSHVEILGFHTLFSQETTSSGTRQNLGQKFSKDLSLEKALDLETDHFERKGFEAVALLSGIKPTDPLGYLVVNAQAQISGALLQFSHGLSDSLSIGVVLPMMHAQTTSNPQFIPSSKVGDIENLLTSADINLPADRERFLQKIQSTVSLIQERLTRWGYHKTTTWERRGVGDMLIASKKRWPDLTATSLASTVGLVVPLGQPEDPDHLLDIPFGEGAWGLFLQHTFEQSHLPVHFFQYGKATIFAPSKGTVRAIRSDERVEVDTVTCTIQKGPRLQLGAGLRWSFASLYHLGMGYEWNRKFKDHYRITGNPLASSNELERDTDQGTHFLIGDLGLSTVEAYRLNQRFIPFEINLRYWRNVASRNSYVAHVAQVGVNLFF